jgi:hypothetical protein
LKVSTGVKTSHAGGLLVDVCSPAVYAGEESVTLPNGMILKFGKTSSPTGDCGAGGKTATVSFSSAFPTALVSVVAIPVDAASVASISWSIATFATTGFTIRYGELAEVAQQLNGFYWFAVGY